MASGSYLDNFLATVEDAPADLRRNLQHMRDLDTEAQELTDRIRKLAKIHVGRAKRAVADGTEPSDEVLHKIRTLHHKVEELGNEKVNLATEMHQAMTRHHRRITEELHRFEVELSERGKLKGATAPTPAAAPPLQSSAADTSPTDAAAEATDRPSKRPAKRNRSGGASTPVPTVTAPAPGGSASKAYRSGSGGSGSRAPTKQQRQRENLDLDLDLGPELTEVGAPQLDALYPDFRLPMASKEDANRPLCGAVAPDDGPLEPGQKVAARISAPKVAPQEWILGTVGVRSGGKYTVSDDDDPKGATLHSLPQSAMIPLPLTEPAVFTRAHEHKEGTPVLAMFPDTTCFYNATVKVAPSKRRERDYLVEFEDDVGVDGRSIWRRVPVKYVVAS